MELRNEELHNSYYSPSVNGIVKSRKVRWADHVERIRRGGEECLKIIDEKARRNRALR
jgi:hypothetical protein